MRRILALRLLEEERESAELARQRQQRQVYLDALDVLSEGSKQAGRSMQAALQNNDTAGALAADMMLATSPMRQQQLESELARRERALESAASRWQEARLRRRQTETVIATVRVQEREQDMRREQRELNDWFLNTRSVPPAHVVDEDETSLRNQGSATVRDGDPRAR
jgi:flagellar export protein FliJ